MADLSQFAERFVSWCAENGTLADPLKEVDFDREPLTLSALDAAIPMLFRRRVTAIGLNETAGEVSIFTNLKPTRADQTLVDGIFNSESDPRVVLRWCGIPSAAPENNLPQGGRGYGLVNDLYTCGSSVSCCSDRSTGTMGALVADESKQIYGLSANHVAAHCSDAAKGFPLIAPGFIDISHDSLTPFCIGRHYSCLPMAPGNPDNVQAARNSDAAMFQILDPDRVTSSQWGEYDTPTAIVTPAPEMRVEKIGRSTGRTSGKIVAKVATPEPVYYPNRGLIYFTDLYYVQSESGDFLKPGDSGSLVTTEKDGKRYAVGLAVACDERSHHGMIIAIQGVLDGLGVQLIAGHNFP